MRNRLFPLFAIVALASSALTGAVPPTPRTPEPPAARRRHVWLLGGPRSFLGVTTLDITPELRAFYGAPKEEGVVVASVEAGSPAASAGIRVGDVITGVDGRPIDSPWGLADELGDHKKGERVSIEIVRERSVRKVEATLAEREPSEGDLAERLAIDMQRTPLPRLRKMEEVFQSPEWKVRLDGLDECERVRKRLESVEERLKSLEQKLPGR